VPELPETETIARDLAASIAGTQIVGARVTRPDVLREVSPRTFARRLKGARILHTWRRAKLIVLDLSTSDRIVVQPRFTGALIVDEGTIDRSQLRYSTVAIELEDGRYLHYCDVRRLGTVALMDERRFAEYTAKLGKEPLDRSFTTAQLSGVLRASAQPVKKVLMDQRRIAGIGNIYANEALWRAGIDPSRAANRVRADDAKNLRTAIVSVLSEAIAARGTSFRDYRDSKGEQGSFAARLEAYGRGGSKCTRCGRKLVTTHAIDSRATTFCPGCQK
jgi:formamidopyrimidine-DNA glycosylase